MIETMGPDNRNEHAIVDGVEKLGTKSCESRLRQEHQSITSDLEKYCSFCESNNILAIW